MLYRMKPVDEKKLTFFIVVERRRSKVEVRYKKDFFFDNHRLNK